VGVLRDNVTITGCWREVRSTMVSAMGTKDKKEFCGSSTVLTRTKFTFWGECCVVFGLLIVISGPAMYVFLIDRQLYEGLLYLHRLKNWYHCFPKLTASMCVPQALQVTRFGGQSRAQWVGLVKEDEGI